MKYFKDEYEVFSSTSAFEDKAMIFFVYGTISCKMETTLFVSSKLTFSNYLLCLNFPLWNKANKLKRAISFEVISYEIPHIPVAPNSSIINIRRVSTLKGRVMSVPF